MEAWQESEELNKKMIDARLKSNFMNYGDNLLGIKLKAATSKESETAMRMDEIIEECKAIYISGQVNSMILLTWTTLLLSLNQYWQEKLREEVFNECGKDTIPDSDTFSRLKLVINVFQFHEEFLQLISRLTHLFHILLLFRISSNFQCRKENVFNTCGWRNSFLPYRWTWC